LRKATRPGTGCLDARGHGSAVPDDFAGQAGIEGDQLHRALVLIIIFSIVDDCVCVDRCIRQYSVCAKNVIPSCGLFSLFQPRFCSNVE